MLAVERFPFGAQLLHVECNLGGLQRLPRELLGALAQLHPRRMLTETVPAFEFDQLLHEAPKPLNGRLWQQARTRLQGSGSVSSRACGLQLTCCKRLLGVMQQRM